MYRQYYTAGTDDAPSGLVTQYQSIGGVGQVSTWQNNDTTTKYIVGTSGHYTGLDVLQEEVNGSGATRAYRFYKNSSAAGVAVEITGDSQVRGFNFSQVSCVIYDFISIGTTPSGGPAGQASEWACEFVPDNPAERQIQSNTGSVSVTSATRFFSVAGQSPVSTTEDQVQSPVCNVRGGVVAVVKKLVVGLSAAPGGATASRTLDFRIGKANQLTVTITAGATTGVATGSINLSDGDLLSYRSVGANSPAACTIYLTLVYEPSVIGEQLLFGNSTDGLRTTAGSEYSYNSTGDDTWSNTSTDRLNLSKTGHVFKAQRVTVTAAPGASKERAFSLYDGDDNLVAGMTGTAVSGISADTHTTFPLTPQQITERHTCPFASTTAASAGWCYQMRNDVPFGAFGAGFGL